MVFLQSNNDMIIFGPPTLSTGYSQAPQITDDWKWCLTWVGKKCNNTALYVHVCSTCVSKAIFREKGRKLSLHKSGEEVSIKVHRFQKRKQEFSHSAGSKNKGDSWIHVSLIGRCPKGTKGQIGGRMLDVRSITLDFGSADRTGSVSLRRTKTGK